MTWRMYHQPSDAEASGADSNAEDIAESLASPNDPLAQLQSDLAAAKTEVAEWQDRFLRKAAEFENYRKRIEKEKIDSMMLAKSSVLLELLPIADACERALRSMGEAANTPDSLDQYQEGVELLYKQLLDALARTGAVPIETERKKFDPRLHEALSREENADFEEDTVIRELRRGYLFKDKLLRPAQVVVAVHPQGKDGSSE